MHNSSLSPPSYGEKVERDRMGLLIHMAEIRALGNAKGHKEAVPFLGPVAAFQGYLHSDNLKLTSPQERDLIAQLKGLHCTGLEMFKGDLGTLVQGKHLWGRGSARTGA